jgi:leader peptidase (prepilin peptidase)/N-methyltransferase
MFDSIWFTLQTQPILAVSVVAILSLLVGSFLNVVIYRLPVMMEREWQANVKDYQEALADGSVKEHDLTSRLSLSVPRSRCGKCGHAIGWYENIPVISYLFLKGQCTGCKTPISLRYPAIELLTCLISAFTLWHFGFNWPGLAAVVLTWCLISLIFIDIDHQLLPDSITLPLLWLGLLLNTQGLFTSLESAIWGAALGYLSLWSVYWAFKLITGKEGMGYGDFKLLAALGAWCGATSLPLIILLSSVVGMIFAVVMMLSKRLAKGNPIPFGPYLAIAGWIALLYGEQIIQSYLGHF